MCEKSKRNVLKCIKNLKSIEPLHKTEKVDNSWNYSIIEQFALRFKSQERNEQGKQTQSSNCNVWSIKVVQVSSIPVIHCILANNWQQYIHIHSISNNSSRLGAWTSATKGLSFNSVESACVSFRFFGSFSWFAFIRRNQRVYQLYSQGMFHFSNDFFSRFCTFPGIEMNNEKRNDVYFEIGECRMPNRL